MYNYLGALGLAAGAGLVAYMLYFDKQRRSAPDYREKVAARRKREREAAERANEIEIPSDPNDKQAVEQFFVKQIELGESLIHTDIDEGLKHLSYAIVFCPKPENLIQYFKEALPTDAYQKLVELVPVANRRAREQLSMNNGPIITEEDVE